MSDSRSMRRVVGGYFTAVLSVLVAVVAQRILWPLIPPSPQLMFYPAVLFAARLGGFGPGALSVVLSSFAMAYWFLPPLVLGVSDDVLDLAIFAAMGFTVAGLMSRMRSAMDKARGALVEADRSRAQLASAYRA